MLCVSLVYRKTTIFSIDYGVFESVDVELPPNKMRLSSPDMFKFNKTEPFFFKFASPILSIGFFQNFSS